VGKEGLKTKRDGRETNIVDEEIVFIYARKSKGENPESSIDDEETILLAISRNYKVNNRVDLLYLVADNATSSHMLRA